MIYPLGRKNKYYFLISVIFSALFLSGCSWSLVKDKLPIFNCGEFYPVCGENDVTYYNQCQAKEEEVDIVYDGACNERDIVTIPYDKAEN